MMKRTLILAAAAAMLLASCAPKTRIATPTMGWSSWNAFMTEISDSIICGQADAMVASGLADAGYRYINIDDGYFGGRDENGTLLVHPVRFPNGIRGVVDHIHSLGLKAGIYSDAGDNTCGSGFNNDTLGFGVGMYGYDTQDAERFFKDWDFDFVKVDFCGGNHLKLDTEERYTEISRAIRSTGKDVVFNVCRWHYPGTWIHDIADSWRISGDINPTWNRIHYCVRKNMYLSAYVWGGHYNDMDMLAVGYNEKPTGLPVGTTLTYEEEEAHFGMWCIMSSPLLLGCDVNYLPERTEEIITNQELIALNQDPLGLQAYVVQNEGETYVFVKDILKRNGRTRAVALYNPSEEEVLFEVPAATLAMSGKMKIRDLNRHEDLEASQSINLSVPAHSARILKVEGRRARQTVYEAEWGYIPTYNDISGDGGKYVPNKDASCGAVVMNLGGSEDNRIEWREVEATGRESAIAVTLFPKEEGSAVLTVNGVPTSFEYAPSEGAVTIDIAVSLKKGNNVVWLSSSEALPPVDCITISRR